MDHQRIREDHGANATPDDTEWEDDINDEATIVTDNTSEVNSNFDTAFQAEQQSTYRKTRQWQMQAQQ
eukprot:scaffold200768_cov33-Attheya_sp.AAC.1